MVFMNHEAPPSIAIDIQSWVRFGSGQLAISLERWTMPTLPAISRKLEMGGLWSVISAVVVACITSAPAQAQSVNRTASGQPNTDIRVGVYVNVRPDCTSGPLPSIQLTSPPENGKVTVKKARYRRPITSNAWRSKCRRSLRFTARAQILWASMF
jgi:hypothetical protein